LARPSISTVRETLMATTLQTLLNEKATLPVSETGSGSGQKCWRPQSKPGGAGL
jgi:hypothetical protein